MSSEFIEGNIRRLDSSIPLERFEAVRYLGGVMRNRQGERQKLVLLKLLELVSSESKPQVRTAARHAIIEILGLQKSEKYEDVPRALSHPF